ncbi:hypothetical protein M378DRAFT_780841 [Amanita muscaria Koide BX008]|uniref:Uncharacterized protein n=1 Tax=Amanita muscaria (strain Koide BX008) TaxID=946122 RepID=A0A0C2TQ37_AMAMK|nr:hypothetical protein M378DRAFT_780841 [Amanita muscaria Koide BX008]
MKVSCSSTIPRQISRRNILGSKFISPIRKLSSWTHTRRPFNLRLSTTNMVSSVFRARTLLATELWLPSYLVLVVTIWFQKTKHEFLFALHQIGRKRVQDYTYTKDVYCSICPCRRDKLVCSLISR